MSRDDSNTIGYVFHISDSIIKTARRLKYKGSEIADLKLLTKNFPEKLSTLVELEDEDSRVQAIELVRHLVKQSMKAVLALVPSSEDVTGTVLDIATVKFQSTSVLEPILHGIDSMLSEIDSKHKIYDIDSEIHSIIPLPATEKKVSKSLTVKNVVNDSKHFRDTFKPSELISKVDEFVVGNMESKKGLAVHVYKHRLAETLEDRTDYKPLHVLITGGTGSGKTLLVDTVSKVLDVPMVSVDLSMITKSGYKGSNLSSVFRQLVDDRGRELVHSTRIKYADKFPNGGIIFFDELDKIISEREEYSIQPELLKLLDSASITIGDESHGRTPLTLDLSNFVFIFAGSFERSFTSKRDKKAVGFGKDDQMQARNMDINDVVKAGLFPELAGRIGTILATESLTDYSIVLNVKKGGVVNYYNGVFKAAGLNKTVTEKDKQAIITLAKTYPTGLRALWTAAAQHFDNSLYI